MGLYKYNKMPVAYISQDGGGNQHVEVIQLSTNAATVHFAKKIVLAGETNFNGVQIVGIDVEFFVSATAAKSYVIKMSSTGDVLLVQEFTKSSQQIPLRMFSANDNSVAFAYSGTGFGSATQDRVAIVKLDIGNFDWTASHMCFAYATSATPTISDVAITKVTATATVTTTLNPVREQDVWVSTQFFAVETEGIMLRPDYTESCDYMPPQLTADVASNISMLYNDPARSDVAILQCQSLPPFLSAVTGTNNFISADATTFTFTAAPTAVTDRGAHLMSFQGDTALGPPADLSFYYFITGGLA